MAELTENKPTIYFYDVVFLTPYSGVNVQTKIKIPAYSVFQALHYMEYLLHINPDLLVEFRKYEIGNCWGNSRVDYKLVSRVRGASLKQFLQAYKRKKSFPNSKSFLIDSTI